MSGLLVVLAAWLAVAVVVAALWSAFARPLTGERRSLGERTRRRRRATRTQVLLLALAVAGASAQSHPEDWQPLPLVAVLAALALASDALPLTIGRYRFTGAFVAIVLAMALLGPAPAVAIGVLCVGIDAARTRPPFGYLMNNLAAYATFPLVGGMFLAEVETTVLLAFACLGAALAVNFLNFLIIAGHAAMRDGDPLMQAVRQTWRPVLNWEIANAAVAAATVYGYLTIGPIVVAGFALSLAVLQIIAARLAATSSRDRTAFTS